MAIEQAYRELVSGRWQGPLAAVLRGGLTALEQPYRWATAQRNWRFDRAAESVCRVDAPVISVGNLTVGGTGKSPFVAWLAQWLVAQGVGVTLISRGYGSRRGGPNDEALELAARLPGVPHLQNRDRVAAARQAVASNPRQVLVLDDAFQHRRLARDLDIVLLDALAPFGYEHLLPRGLLRESVEGLARAHVIGLSRSDAVAAETREWIWRRVGELAPRALRLEIVHRPTRLVAASGAELPTAALQEKPVAAFCGIGNPAGFRHTLQSQGMHLAGWLELPDHCAYGEKEWRDLEDWAGGQCSEQVVCTRKDLVKIGRDTIGGKPLWALEIEMQIASGQADFEGILSGLTAQFHST